MCADEQRVRMRRGRVGERRREGRGLQGTARVQQSDSCGQEAVSEPGGFALKAPQLPTRGKRQEHVVSGVGGVFHDADREPQRSKVKGRLLPAVLCAAFTTLCRDFLSAAVQLPVAQRCRCRGCSPLHSGRSSPGWSSPVRHSAAS